MSVVLLNKYQLGDMRAEYYLDEEKGIAGWMLLPACMEGLKWEEKNQEIDSLVQLKISGDTYPGGYAGGGTLRQSESVFNMRYQDQIYEQSEQYCWICTILGDNRGYQARHYLEWKKGKATIESYTEFSNRSDKAVKLELLSSFSLGGITPFAAGDAYESIDIHRVRSVWSMEGRMETTALEDLQLEPSWAGHAVRCERFGQVGSLPVNHFFPQVIVEDKQSNVFWGVQIAHNASWQIELYRRDDGLSVSGGLADREFGQWMKTIAAGGYFVTPRAILTVCRGGTADDTAQRLVSAGQDAVNAGPASEQSLPVIFNEYCTTWVCPSHENICSILERIRNKGFSYFVIDCGWYKEEGVSWDIAMGDYQVSPELFPEGLQKTVDAIRDAGMFPGIWFEIDNVGSQAKAYRLEDHLLKRDGRVLTTTMRRFWDMSDPWVEEYLTDKVIRPLKEYGFRYMKMDYNDTVGVGCDHPDSLGEGLRENMESSLNFIRKVKREVPDIILENCASGGQKQEPLMMAACSMSSFSDAHECEEIPIIAANLHRVILPRQSQIWAVIRKEDSIKRIAYSVSSTFLGRMCISGDVVELSREQWDMLERGITFYKEVAEIIKDGHTYWYGPDIKSYRHPDGWQGIVRVGGNGEAMVVIHVFDGAFPEVIEIDLSRFGSFVITSMYSHRQCEAEIENGIIKYRPRENMSAMALHFKNCEKHKKYNVKNDYIIDRLNMC